MANWYGDGLRFACSRCGRCCTGDPGTVLVSDREISGLAELGEFSESRFRKDYTRTLGDGRVVLREREDGTCVFYDSRQGCTVYEARPRQCRTYPFWQKNLSSPEAWATEADACPGIGRGERHTEDIIEERQRRDGTLSQARKAQAHQLPDT